MTITSMTAAQWVIVVAAIISGISALIVSLINYSNAARDRTERRLLQTQQLAFQTDLERLKATLGEQRDEEAARREYRYEATKRLYLEAEPLLFQLDEACKAANGHILSFARAARSGALDRQPSPLAINEDYLISSIYVLLAPAALVELIRRRLTGVDLTLDPYIKRQYRLADTISRLFSRDFALAKLEPKLTYSPHDLLPGGAATASTRQGAYIREISRAVEGFLYSEEGVTRMKPFPRFEDDINDQGSSTYRYLSRFRDLFLEFSPSRMPVTWRILVSQYFLMSAFRLEVRDEISRGDADRALERLARDPGQDFDFRPTNKRHGDPDDVKIAKNYLKTALKV